ncbi:Uncharacterised protein [Neisseria weaveri]|uniref:Uncharacterized protein n=1 Tax=Neisseria weaveri TaxID=28091 RepID=A0A3S4ZMU8_9NEIS|nr:Uncharacterised protein [Neisseria weaveri]VEJ51986.1 Uncharacterised protein [Neisseria weaveri]
MQHRRRQTIFQAAKRAVFNTPQKTAESHTTAVLKKH